MHNYLLKCYFEIINEVINDGIFHIFSQCWHVKWYGSHSWNNSLTVTAIQWLLDTALEHKLPWGDPSLRRHNDKIIFCIFEMQFFCFNLGMQKIMLFMAWFWYLPVSQIWGMPMKRLVVRNFAYCHYKNGHWFHCFFALLRFIVFIVSSLASGLRGLGSSPGQRHCVVFLGKTLNSNSASLHLGV